MRTGLIVRLSLALFCLSVFVSNAHAVTITNYFAKVGTLYTSAHDSADAACRALYSEGIITAYVHVATGPGTMAGSCYGRLKNGTSQTGVGTWERTDLVCEYGSADGKTCDPPPAPEDCLAGGPGIFSKSGPVVNSNGSNYVVTSGGGSVCYGQCSHTLADRAASCYATAEGASTGFCNYIGTPTGETCAQPDAPLGSTGAPLNPADTPNVPPSDPNDPGCPDGYGWSGTTCSKLPPPDGGDTGGGDTGGGDTGGGDTGGGGGGGDSGGGDTGGGDTGGDTGGGDTGGGDEGGGEIGDGTGGGTGGGTGDGEGEGEEGAGSGPGFCDGGDCGFVPPSYFGGAEKVPGFEQSLTRIFDGISASPIGSSVTAISFPSSSGTCPAGSVELFGKRVTFDGHCTLWAEISGIFSALMLAVWCLLGVRIVLSS